MTMFSSKMGTILICFDGVRMNTLGHFPSIVEVILAVFLNLRRKVNALFA